MHHLNCKHLFIHRNTHCNTHCNTVTHYNACPICTREHLCTLCDTYCV